MGGNQAQQDSTSLAGSLEPMTEVTLPPGFKEVMAVQDEAMGITYMDMVTTSMGQVALIHSCLGAQAPGLIIEDVTILP